MQCWNASKPDITVHLQRISQQDSRCATAIPRCSFRDPILSCEASVCYFLASVRAFPFPAVLAAESHYHNQSSATSVLSLATKTSAVERHSKHPSHIDPVRTHAQESTVPHIQINPRSMASLQSLTSDRLRSSLRPHAGASSFAQAQERSSNVLRQHGLGLFHTRCCRDAEVHADHDLLSVSSNCM